MYNAYTIPSGHTRSVSPVDLFPQHYFPTLVLGDLNIHHSTLDPTRLLSDYNQFISSPYVERASAQLYFVLNTPVVYTRFPFTSNHRPAVLDFSFANSALLRYWSSWNLSLPQTGSDLTALTIILCIPLVKPLPWVLNWKYTDWDHISALLANLTLATPPRSPLRAHLTYGSTTALPRSHTSSPRTPQPGAHSPTLNRGGLPNLYSYDAFINIPPTSSGKMRARPPRPLWLRTHISRLFNLPREFTVRSGWPTSTCDHSGMLDRFQPAEPQIVYSHSRMPPPSPKLTIHFYNIFSLLEPLLRLASSFLRLRTSPVFTIRSVLRPSKSSNT